MKHGAGRSSPMVVAASSGSASSTKSSRIAAYAFGLTPMNVRMFNHASLICSPSASRA